VLGDRHPAVATGRVAVVVRCEPMGDVTGTAWRYALMTWGHNPTT